MHADAGTLALLAAFSGLILAFLLYGVRVVNPADIARQLRGLHGFLVEKWEFDNLYEVDVRAADADRVDGGLPPSTAW